MTVYALFEADASCDEQVRRAGLVHAVPMAEEPGHSMKLGNHGCRDVDKMPTPVGSERHDKSINRG